VNLVVVSNRVARGLANEPMTGGLPLRYCRWWRNPARFG